MKQNSEDDELLDKIISAQEDLLSDLHFIVNDKYQLIKKNSYENNNREVFVTNASEEGDGEVEVEETSQSEDSQSPSEEEDPILVMQGNFDAMFELIKMLHIKVIDLESEILRMKSAD